MAKFAIVSVCALGCASCGTRDAGGRRCGCVIVVVRRWLGLVLGFGL